MMKFTAACTSLALATADFANSTLESSAQCWPDGYCFEVGNVHSCCSSDAGTSPACGYHFECGDVGALDSKIEVATADLANSTLESSTQCWPDGYCFAVGNAGSCCSKEAGTSPSCGYHFQCGYYDETQDAFVVATASPIEVNVTNGDHLLGLAAGCGVTDSHCRSFLSTSMFSLCGSDLNCQALLLQHIECSASCICDLIQYDCPTTALPVEGNATDGDQFQGVAAGCGFTDSHCQSFLSTAQAVCGSDLACQASWLQNIECSASCICELIQYDCPTTASPVEVNVTNGDEFFLI
jgi:hypothetical protein